MTRRHRIHEPELEPAFEAITNELAVIASSHEADMVPLLRHIHLFRLWWRIKEGREGKPSYPTPITYGTIRGHVATASHSIGLLPQGELQPDLTPQTDPRAGAIIKEVE